MKLSVIIPAYNEEKNILTTLAKVIAYLNLTGLDWEVLVVDDGSSDKTFSLVAANFPGQVKLLRHLNNQGKGAAVRSGALAALGEAILFLDADYSTEITELDNFLPQLKAGGDLIIGSRALPASRIIKKQFWLKIFLGQAGNGLIQLLLGLPVKDSQCGFKLFSKKALMIFSKQKINRWGFDFELLFLAKKYGLAVAELPVTWTNQPASRVRTRDYFKTLVDLIKLKIDDLRGLYEK